jgi:membrane-associated phospholipid phosphatase
MDALDAIEALDDGAAAHFGFQAKQFPPILPVMQYAYYLSAYAGIGILVAIIVFFLLIQGRRRSAILAVISVAVAIAVIQTAQIVVPRARPQDAVLWLGPDARFGSYPSSGVFLFTLAMILLGNALWGFMRRPWQAGLYVLTAALLTVWVCLSQFFLSIHYVTDVIGGMAGAALIGWITICFMERARAAVAPPTNEPIPTPPAPADGIQDLSRTQGIQKN